MKSIILSICLFVVGSITVAHAQQHKIQIDSKDYLFELYIARPTNSNLLSAATGIVVIEFKNTSVPADIKSQATETKKNATTGFVSEKFLTQAWIVHAPTSVGYLYNYKNMTVEQAKKMVIEKIMQSTCGTLVLN